MAACGAPFAGGGQQTVYRAELYAACRAFELASGPVTVVSDCYGVVQQAQSVIKRGLRSGAAAACGLVAPLERRGSR